MLKRLFVSSVVVALALPSIAVADGPAKGAEQQVPTDKPVTAPATATDPAKIATDDNHTKWLDAFKVRYPKVAEHYSKLREELVAARTKWEANKTDKALKDQVLIQRRRMHQFWANFRARQIQHARHDIKRWQTQVRWHRDKMRKLAQEELK